MPTINGKEVTFKETLAAKHWWSLLPKLTGLSADTWLESLDLDTVCQIVAGGVESWEFDGKPNDHEAIIALDAFTVLLPLVREIIANLTERLTLGE